MTEMTAAEYLKEKARMTENCNMCNDCPFEFYNNGEEIPCGRFEATHSEKAISIVQKFAEEHPAKTMLQDFFEKHPKAPRRAEGDPIACVVSLGYRTGNDGCYGNNCFECWNRPLEE